MTIEIKSNKVSDQLIEAYQDVFQGRSRTSNQSVALSHNVILFCGFYLRVMASSSVQELPKVLNVSLLELLQEQHFVHWSVNSNGSITSVVIRQP